MCKWVFRRSCWLSHRQRHTLRTHTHTHSALHRTQTVYRANNAASRHVISKYPTNAKNGMERGATRDRANKLTKKAKNPLFFHIKSFQLPLNVSTELSHVRETFIGFIETYPMHACHTLPLTRNACSLMRFMSVIKMTWILCWFGRCKPISTNRTNPLLSYSTAHMAHTHTVCLCLYLLLPKTIRM